MMQTAESASVVGEDSDLNCMDVWGGNTATDTFLSRPGLDVWVHSQPRSNAVSGGGDLHLISSCASGRITRILLSDVCSFGSVFEEVVSDFKELMKQNANWIRQWRAVRCMSENLERAASNGGFASTMISTYFAPTRSFVICNAGHAPPLVCRAASREWSVVKQQPATSNEIGDQFGIVAPDEYQQFEMKLESGDMILSYSNALTDCRSKSGCTIGLVGLLEHVRKLDHLHPSQVPARLVEELQSEHVDNLDGCDSTVILCRATNSAVRWQDNLLAPFRLLRSVTDSTRIE